MDARPRVRTGREKTGRPQPALGPRRMKRAGGLQPALELQRMRWREKERARLACIGSHGARRHRGGAAGKARGRGWALAQRGASPLWSCRTRARTARCRRRAGVGWSRTQAAAGLGLTPTPAEACQQGGKTPCQSYSRRTGGDQWPSRRRRPRRRPPPAGTEHTRNDGATKQGAPRGGDTTVQTGRTRHLPARARNDTGWQCHTRRGASARRTPVAQALPRGG